MQTFNPSDMFRLRHSLVALVEELKFRKKCETDNEAKIQELVNQNHVLQREMDAEQQRARLKEEELVRAVNEMKQEHENTLRRLDADQRQRNVKAESKVYVEDKMKEDMRQLQMTIFHQEKSIKELETKLQTQESSSEKTLSQWASVERKISAFTEVYQSTLDSVSRLKQDVVKAVALNKKLSYLNQHHQCEMKDKCSEICRLQDEILKIKTQMSCQPLGVYERQDLRTTIDNLNIKIKHLEDEVVKQNEEVEHQSERAKQAVASLQSAHILVSKHLDRANKCWAENEKLSEECAALAANCETMKSQLSIADESLERMNMSMTKASEEWRQKENELEDVIKTKCQQLQSLEESKTKLEEMNSELSGKHEDLLQLLAEAKTKLNVARSETGVQAGCSLFSVTDTSSQASLNVQNMTTQTTCSETVHALSQTDHKMTLSTLVQTDEVTIYSEANQMLSSYISSDDSDHTLHNCSQPVATVVDSHSSPKDEHQIVVMHLYGISTSNSHDDENLDFGEVKNEPTDCSELSTYILEGDSNDSIAVKAQNKSIRYVNENNREMYVPTDNVPKRDSLTHLNSFHNAKTTSGINTTDVPAVPTGCLQPFPTYSFRVRGRNNSSAGVFSDCLYEASGFFDADRRNRSAEVCVVDSTNVKLEVGASGGRGSCDVPQVCFLHSEGHVQSENHLQPVGHIQQIDQCHQVDHDRPVDLLKSVVHFKPVGPVQPVGHLQPVGHVQSDGHTQPVAHGKPLDHVQPIGQVQHPGHVQPADHIKPSHHVQPGSNLHHYAASTVSTYINNSLSKDVLVYVPQTRQFSNTVSLDHHTIDGISNTSNNNEDKIIMTANTEQVLTGSFINISASATVQEAETAHKKSSLDVETLSMHTENPRCTTIEDIANINKENKLTPHFPVPSIASESKEDFYQYGISQATEDASGHPQCVKQVPHSLKFTEEGDHIWRTSESTAVPDLSVSKSVYILNIDRVPSCCANYKMMYNSDGTAILSLSIGQDLSKCGRDLGAQRGVQSSDFPDVCIDRVQTTNTYNIYADRAKCDDKGNICLDRTESSDTANVCEDKETKKASSTCFQHTQVSSSTVSIPSLNTEALFSKLEMGFLTDAEEKNQTLSCLPSLKCTDPYCFQTEDNITSEDVVGGYRREKRTSYSLKLAKPGRASGNSALSSRFSFTSSTLSHIIPSVAMSSRTVTRTDLAASEDSQLYPHGALSLPTSSTSQVSPVHHKKEDISLLYPSTSIFHPDQTIMFTSSSLSSHDIHGLSVGQISPESSNTNMGCLNNAPLFKVSSPSNSSICCKDQSNASLMSVDYHLFIESNQHKRCSKQKPSAPKQREKSQRGGSRNKRGQMMFLPSPVIKGNQDVIGYKRKTQSDSKTKGILKGPSCKRTKSLTSKSVTFHQQLEFHMHGLTPQTQESQQASTSLTSTTTFLANLDVKEVNSSHGAPPAVKEKPVGCITDLETISHTSMHTQIRKDVEASVTSSGSPASYSHSRPMTTPCFIVPETPNLEFSDTEIDFISNPVSAEVSLESPVADGCSYLSKHSLDGISASNTVHVVDSDCPALKKHKK